MRFHKRSTDGSAKCSIVASPGGLHVAVFDISVADKYVLDRIEGLGAGYAETVLSVPGAGDCVSYIAEKTHIDESLLPYDWYKELVLSGAQAHGFPEGYLARIREQPVSEDPDPVRRIDSWKTVERVRSGA